MYMWVFGGARINMTELQPFELSQFRHLFAFIVGYGVCVINSSYRKHFEAMHICCGYFFFFADEKIIFDKITAFWTQTIFRLGFNLG